MLCKFRLKSCCLWGERIAGYSTTWTRLILQIILLAIFLHFFGLNAFAKYQKSEVMVVETSQDTDGIPLPAITIGIARGDLESELHRHCYDLNTSIADCIEAKTPNVSKILKGVLFGYKNTRTHLLQDSEIIEDFTATRAGRLITLTLPIKIGPDDYSDQFFLALEPTFVQIMLHDPNYFIFNDNPVGLPTAMTIFDAKTMFKHYHRIALTKVQEMDLPSDRCNNDQSYNFNACVRKSLVRQV